MKLLLDENLSPLLVAALAPAFPGTAHVHALGLGAASDSEIWAHAAANDYTIVTRDSDYYERSLIRGFPPKIVWIRRGNCSTDLIRALLVANRESIERLGADPDGACLVLY